jgi:hypothetical protein
MRWHGLRTAGRMRLRILLVAACLIVSAEVVAAQDWRSAWERQDYVTASRLLHRTVLALPGGVDDPDPLAAEHLAILYAHGLGVRPDPVVACSVMRWASGTAGVHRPGDDATFSRLSEQGRALCATLGQEEYADAGNMTGCLVFEVPAERFHLGRGHSVQITRTGLRILHGASIVDEEVSPFGCHRQVALVRYRPVLTPNPAGVMATRHFIEFFAWTSVHDKKGRPTRTLTWVLMEVAGSSAFHREQEVVAERPASTWPPDVPAVPLPDTFLTPLPDGTVGWRLGTRLAKSGVVEPLRETR